MRAYMYGDTVGAAAELACAARELGAESELVVLGETAPFEGVAVDAIAALRGGSERPEAYARFIAERIRGNGGGVFLAASTCRARELAALVAGYLGCAMFSDVTSLHTVEGGGLRATRMMYGGAVTCGISASLPVVVTVSSGVYEPATGGAPKVEELVANADTRVRRISAGPMPKGAVDLTQADRVVAVGLGFGEKEDLSLAYDLAAALDAEVGCTRDVAEGRGWLPREHYIGITGAQIKPSLYVGVGVSGSMQHVYGIRDAKVVVGINKAKDAPIFRAADYGIVGDLYEVVPAFIAAVNGG